LTAPGVAQLLYSIRADFTLPIFGFSVQLRQMASRVKQAGPGYEEAATLLRQSADKLIAARIATARRLGQPQPQLN